MSTIPETAALIAAKIDHIETADDHLNQAQTEVTYAIEDGDVAKESLKKAAIGLAGYLRGTKDALDAGTKMEKEIDTTEGEFQNSLIGTYHLARAAEHAKNAHEHSQRAAEKRDEAITGGNQTVDSVRTALNGLVGFLDHTETTSLQAANTSNWLLNARDLGMGGSEHTLIKGMQEKTEAAHEAADAYKTTISKAHDKLSQEVVRSWFNRLAQRLEEGVALLEGSRGKPTAEFNPAVAAAIKKIPKDAEGYLWDLYSRTCQGTQLLLNATTKGGEVTPLTQSALEDGKAYLARL